MMNASKAATLGEQLASEERAAVARARIALGLDAPPPPASKPHDGHGCSYAARFMAWIETDEGKRYERFVRESAGRAHQPKPSPRRA